MSQDSITFACVRRTWRRPDAFFFNNSKQIQKKMQYLKTPPIPPMEAGPERELMACLFRKVKHMKGLTTALDQFAGVNGKWLKPEEPRNIPSKRLLRIVLHSMLFLGREECKRRANQAIDHVFDHILPPYVDYLASKRKQRPPSIRRLYRRRYRFTHITNPYIHES